MSFAENLKRLRKEKGLTQEQLARQIGVGKRAVIGYEVEGRYPKKHEVYQKIADALGCTTNDLLTDNSDQFVAKAQEEYGSRGRRQAEDAVNTITGLFAGGELSEEDRDAVARAIQDVYWFAKERNRKYAPFRFRNDK
ncbi:MAG: helix-turn-helix domain-containing protein [Lachnospiraceae bacterium]|nr:helix-turn-helix domain-containing protein [Lachnospiraceae bacterium]